jgi:DNA processing protein
LSGSEKPNAKAYKPEELLGPLNPVEQANAPPVLYASGDTGLLHHGLRVAVVGSRSASADGIKRTAQLARFLVSHGVVVVSGLAEGIDTSAHRSAIDAGGHTIAVLGTPPERAYPKENADLQRLIVERHLALTQFGPGCPVTRTNFPRRNRTMALVAAASVIVEAGNSSGALSQGWEALRLGRLLFIMKSTVENPELSWPTEMLKYGAQILSRPEEVLDFIPIEAGGPRASLAL